VPDIYKHWRLGWFIENGGHAKRIVEREENLKYCFPKGASNTTKRRKPAASWLIYLCVYRKF